MLAESQSVEIQARSVEATQGGAGANKGVWDSSDADQSMEAAAEGRRTGIIRAWAIGGRRTDCSPRLPPATRTIAVRALTVHPASYRQV